MKIWMWQVRDSLLHLKRIYFGLLEDGGEIGGSGIQFPSAPVKRLADLRNRVNSQRYSSIYEDQRPKIQDIERSDSKKSAPGINVNPDKRPGCLGPGRTQISNSAARANRPKARDQYAPSSAAGCLGAQTQSTWVGAHLDQRPGRLT